MRFDVLAKLTQEGKQSIISSNKVENLTPRTLGCDDG